MTHHSPPLTRWAVTQHRPGHYLDGRGALRLQAPGDLSCDQGGVLPNPADEVRGQPGLEGKADEVESRLRLDHSRPLAWQAAAALQVEMDPAVMHGEAGAPDDGVGGQAPTAGVDGNVAADALDPPGPLRARRASASETLISGPPWVPERSLIRRPIGLRWLAIRLAKNQNSRPPRA